ncbi:MAG TPA: hypothetical protein VGN63_19570 [Flavisolibacter sp.]|jgi:hypothetical protein|nr:hypothetical protein [Flavisolibacter sp.]
MKKIHQTLERKRAQVEGAALNRLIRIGEQFIADARGVDTYKDQTGVLRSSIGYVILKDSLQLTNSGFVQILDGDEGSRKGLELALKVAERHPKGLVLICVAGAEYALMVEMKGYDVISSSAITAESALQKAFARLQKVVK